MSRNRPAMFFPYPEAAGHRAYYARVECSPCHRDVCDDLLVMYPPVGLQRASRLAQLALRARLTVALDSEVAAADLSRAAVKAGSTVRVLVEIDAGMHRVGVQTPAEAAALGRRVAALPKLEVAGIAFYPGHIRGPVGEHAAQVNALSALVADVKATFAQQGLPTTVVSAGSTPTFWSAHEVAGLNEIRPGTYIFNDRTTSAIGACAAEVPDPPMNARVRTAHRRVSA